MAPLLFRGSQPTPGEEQHFRTSKIPPLRGFLFVRSFPLSIVALLTRIAREKT
ncbi:MAG: hypothetical protein M0042_12785 [Nitrospiraceae bacterium]|nr:hypothetical protein [Nitrospiraceae bacterium]